ncbi:hypothetical protein Pcinc_031960 [Petrolisthes cinctipes]|uniref:Uncharacterized protein n=1 Tax=Petrolisthes cinctipes TaxID=88211 RepID=A0AAE1EVB3_PETCI|nr:hypothetical protein Pcinc_031960 [Petrolisthes cinctipes]
MACTAYTSIDVPGACKCMYCRQNVWHPWQELTPYTHYTHTLKPLTHTLKLLIYTLKLLIYTLKSLTHTLKLLIYTLKPLTHTLKLLTHTLKPLTHTLKPLTIIFKPLTKQNSSYLLLTTPHPATSPLAPTTSHP